MASGRVVRAAGRPVAAPGGSQVQPGQQLCGFFSRRGGGFLRLPGLRGVRSDAIPLCFDRLAQEAGKSV